MLTLHSILVDPYALTTVATLDGC